MEKVVLDLLYNLLILLATLLAGYAVAWLRKKIGVEGMKKIESELATKQELATLAVRFVEQTYKYLHGEAKYNKAAEWLVAQAARIGLKLTEEEIKGLIEAALRELKDAFGNEWAKQIQT